MLSCVGKARGSKAAVRLVRELVDTHEEIDTNYPVYYAHARNEEGVQQLMAPSRNIPPQFPL